MQIVSCSDLHLGHPRVPVERTIASLHAYMFPHLESSQILLIGGDIFHQLLKIDSISAQKAIAFIHDLLQYCKRKDIAIRVLRGTYTHDRGQVELFNTLNEKIQADLICYDRVDFEYLKKYDLKLLYIPDNLPYKTTIDCIDEIQTQLTTLGWSSVDLVVGHGYFTHVLPPGIPREPHCTFHIDHFKKIVSGLVLMGHVHTHSKYKNILYNGSFDRLNHGEEEAKGFLLIEKEDKWKTTFVQNPDATPFITIHPNGNSIEELIKSIKSQITEKFGEYPWGHLRISFDNSEKRQILIQHILSIYGTNLVVTGISTKTEQQTQKIILEPQFETIERIVPTMDNLPELTYQHIQKTQPNVSLSIDTIRTLISDP